MTKQKLWELIEAYRISGGSEEHHARKERLDAVLDELLAQPAVPQGHKQEPDRGVYWKCVRCGYAHIEDECPHCGFHTRAEFDFPLQRKPLTHEQRFDLLTKFEPHKNKWEAPAILIDMVEAAHGIKE